MQTLKNNFWPLFSVIVLVLLFFWKVVVYGLVPIPADLVASAYLPWRDYKWGYEVGVPVKNPIVSDSISFIYPARILGVNLIKKGLWPLWNPYLLNGAPLLANFQSAPFSPTNILYFLFDNTTAWSWQVILQHIVAGLFCYILLRHWKVSKLASVFGAITFAFSGFCLIWSQWGVHTLVTAFIPLILFLEDKYLQTRKCIYGLGLSLAFAMQLFSGYPQIVLYTLVAVFLLALIRLKFNKFGKEEFLKNMFLGLFIGFGIGLASLQVFPANELVGLSQRKVEPIPVHWVFFHFDELVTLLAPDYFGNHATGNYWGPKNYLATVGYIGVVPVILAVIGLWRVKRKENLFLILLVFISWVLALRTPLSYFLWQKNIFGLQAGISYKSLSLFTLAVSVAAGFGFDELQSKVGGKLRVWVALALPWLVILGYIVATSYFYLVTRDNPELSLVRGIPKYEVALRNLIFPSGILFLSTVVITLMKRLQKFGGFILLFLLVFELFRFGWKFTPFVPKHLVFPTTPVWEFLIKESEKGVPFRVSGGDITSVNLNVPYMIEFLGGYDAVYPLVAAKFIAAVNSGESGGSPQDRFGIVSNPTSRMTNLMNMKYLFVKSGSVYDKMRFTSAFADKSVTILENKNVLPRSFVVYDWEVEGQADLVIKKLLEPAFPLGEKIILDKEPGIEKDNQGGLAKVEYLKYSEQKSILKVETQKDGLLFVSDTFYPDWRAYVDGKETKVLQADYAFRAVVVPQGSHKIEFIYFPDSFSRGLKVSAISFIGLIGFYLSFALLGKRSTQGYT